MAFRSFSVDDCLANLLLSAAHQHHLDWPVLSNQPARSDIVPLVPLHGIAKLHSNDHGLTYAALH